MRGDFSRIRFNPYNGYTTVLDQQGRVSLDADVNEQGLIDDWLRATESVDVIGQYGTSAISPGFTITVSAGEIQIGAGRYYVGGLVCDNAAPLSYDDQPYLLSPDASGSDLLAELEAAQGSSVVQLYLEAWQRLVTQLDDNCLQEPALGQADTTARLQTVWRVVAALVATPPTPAPNPLLPPDLSSCCQAMYPSGGNVSFSTPGSLNAQPAGNSSDCGCQPIPAAGYQGVENQLYRIEIHQGGDESAATFKWSRENGSVVSAVTQLDGQTVQVNSLGPDPNLGFGANQWVELSDDFALFGQRPNQPGELYQVASIQPSDPSLTLMGSVTPVDPTHNARVRRWDQSGPSAGSAGVPLQAGTWITLENGIEVCFGDGDYRPGDYWTIPARTAIGSILWPPCGVATRNGFVEAANVAVQRAPLGCIHYVPQWRPLNPTVGQNVARSELAPAAEAQLAPSRSQDINISRQRGTYTVDDCRLKFEPLTALAATTTPQAIHVTNVSWVNDDIMTLDQLVANGLTVSLDQTPSSPVNGANFIVTVEPFSLTGESLVLLNRLGADGDLPPTLPRSITVLDDSQIVVGTDTLQWQLPFQEQDNFADRAIVAFVESLVEPGAVGGIFARVRVKLLGEAIFATGASGRIYLDGKAFGQPATRADGRTPRIDLELPSGAGTKASDLDGWFYLAPVLEVASVVINYPTLQVIIDNANVMTGVASTESPGVAVTPTATVTLSYPAITATTLSASVAESGSTSASTIATVPASEPITVGQSTVTVPISVVGNPGIGDTGANVDTFSLTVSVASALGSTSSTQATFTVTGALNYK